MTKVNMAARSSVISDLDFMENTMRRARGAGLTAGSCAHLVCNHWVRLEITPELRLQWSVNSEPISRADLIEKLAAVNITIGE